MNESMLNSLMRLFAIIVSINRGALHILARNFVESFLTQQFSTKLAQTYLQVFDTYAREMEINEKEKLGKKIASRSVKILGICHQIVEELHLSHRFMILLSLLRFTKYSATSSPALSDFSNTIQDTVRTIADGLLIPAEEFDNCAAFIQDKFYNVPWKDELLIVNDDEEFTEGEVRHLQKARLPGQILVLRIRRADIYLFQYTGKARLEVNGKYIFPRHTYLLPRGGSIRGEGIPPIYYSDIVAGYISYTDGHAITFYAKDISYHFRNTLNGIQPFSFQGRSGQLVGIIGGSGAGKSTLLKLLNGSLKPHAGGIYINGHNLHRKNRELEGMIGYIPQDDLLIEELTVYQNLHFNARLCLDGFSGGEIEASVNHLLKELDLFEARHLKVGTPLNKYISGGQRKRLNIALELIREPQVLFVDEPTSGLSSTDSENVIALLKEQALKGKLVLSTIHQPSSELFKQFDHLLIIDRGGYMVYSGNPMDGITYFKQLAQRVDASESECSTCGHTNPDDILNIIEERDVDQYGAFTSRRRRAPEEWYQHYQEKIVPALTFSSEKVRIPGNKFSIPGTLRQFQIFFQRNLLSKLADRQFMAIALLVAPLLALILGYFSKYVAGDESDPHHYVFSQNENLPAYLFMSVIVALFLGLIIAAEEIIRDRRIQERESFLNLSRSAYLLSKISLLVLLSAIQMLMFVIIGNLVMEIRDMTWTYWLVLFSTACFANLLGLNISDGLKSVVAIYVIVPFLLVPQILLAGVIVKFDRLYYRFASDQVVPLAGDLMTSRWAYEALAVTQFVGNRYQKPLFGLEKLTSNVTYDMQFLVPALIQETDDALKLLRSEADRWMLSGQLALIRNALESIQLIQPYPGLDRLTPERFSESEGEELVGWLKKYQNALRTHRDRLTYEMDRLVDSLKQEAGGLDRYIERKRRYDNDQLATLVLNRSELHKLIKTKGNLIRKMDPVYMDPVKKNGRAHFYASSKRIGNLYINTLAFNTLVIWVMNILLALLLKHGALRKTIGFFADLRRKE